MAMRAQDRQNVVPLDARTVPLAVHQSRVNAIDARLANEHDFLEEPVHVGDLHAQTIEPQSTRGWTCQGVGQLHWLIPAQPSLALIRAFEPATQDRNAVGNPHPGQGDAAIAHEPGHDLDFLPRPQAAQRSAPLRNSRSMRSLASIQPRRDDEDEPGAEQPDEQGETDENESARPRPSPRKSRLNTVNSSHQPREVSIRSTTEPGCLAHVLYTNARYSSQCDELASRPGLKHKPH